MPCYHPLKGIRQIAVNASTGKQSIKVVPYSYQGHYDLLLPCGQCVGCRLDKSREWADRILLELPYHESSYFVTLTYDDAHVPYSEYMLDSDLDGLHVPFGKQDVVIDERGEVLNRVQKAQTLSKRDFQLFFKRLRKSIDYPIRYFLAGEYGPSTLRPHGHAVIFGLKLDDLKYYKRNHNGDVLYTSDFMTKIWQNGHVVIGSVTWESAAYVARYCVGKSYKPADYRAYDRFNMVKPFIVMSRKPGIGYQFYEDHKKEIFSDTKIAIPSSKGKLFYPSSYFKNLFAEEDPERAQELQDERLKRALLRVDAEMMQTDIKDYEAYLTIKEREQLRSAKTLVRNEV